MAPCIPRLCRDGRLEKVRAALARGEEVNQRDVYGSTGLMLAARNGREDVVELLLQQPGLDVNLTGGRYKGQPCTGPVDRHTLALLEGCWLIPL